MKNLGFAGGYKAEALPRRVGSFVFWMESLLFLDRDAARYVFF
jgi:hypothetical protein